MKRNFFIIATLIFGAAGCAGWNSNHDQTSSAHPGILNGRAGTQSYSSDVNPSSSSRNVGQSGATTNQFGAPPKGPEDTSLP